MTRITLIVAYAHHYVIGKDNSMPWHLPEDLAHFKQTTSYATVIMGRKTWESIGRALPNRRNIVISRNTELQLEQAETSSSLSAALALCAQENEIFIIGGAQIFKEAMPLAHRIVVTEIDKEFEGDTFFPTIDSQQWQEIKRESHRAKPPNDFSFAIIEYQRRILPI